MNGKRHQKVSRRAVLTGGAAAGAALLLPACAGGGDLGGLGGGGLAGVGGAFSLADVLRRLLTLSSQNAFAHLSDKGEFWQEQIGQMDLVKMTGNGTNVLSRMLASSPFKSELEDQFVGLAAEASKLAEPLVFFQARNIYTNDATKLLRRRPGEATNFLRKEMGDKLIDAIVPGLGRDLRKANNPALGSLVSPLGEAEIDRLAKAFAKEIEEIIWAEIASEERAIRANPQDTGDLLLIRVFGEG